MKNCPSFDSSSSSSSAAAAAASTSSSTTTSASSLSSSSSASSSFLSSSYLRSAALLAPFSAAELAYGYSASRHVPRRRREAEITQAEEEKVRPIGTSLSISAISSGSGSGSRQSQSQSLHHSSRNRQDQPHQHHHHQHHHHSSESLLEDQRSSAADLDNVLLDYLPFSPIISSVADDMAEEDADDAALDESSRIEWLVSMGFPHASCVTALRKCHNNITAACEWLMEHGSYREVDM